MAFKLENSTKIILKVVFAGLILVFLWLIRDIILLLILSVILASAMDPMVEYLNQKRIPRAVSVLSAYVLILGSIVLLVYAVTPAVVEQLKILQANIPEYSERLQLRFGGFLGNQTISSLFEGVFSNFRGDNILVSGTFGIFNGFVSVVTVLVVSFYLVSEDKGMKKFVADLIPSRHQETTVSLLDKIQKKMGMWVVGQLILSASIFLFTLIGLLILRVPNALLLAIFAGLMEVVPYIGPFISAIPAVIVAFIVSPALALGVAIMYLLIQKTEGYVLVPKIMQKTIGTSPLVVLIALLVGLKLAGVLGLLIAVPLVSAIILIFQELSVTNTDAGIKEPV
jgi:predicted PurR-regulated permease PerM